jgi:hypothetical protein
MGEAERIDKNEGWRRIILLSLNKVQSLG